MTQLPPPRAKTTPKTVRKITCPICSKRLRPWRIILALALSRLRCPRCGAKLRFTRGRRPLIAISLAAGVVTGLVVVSLWSSGRLSTAAAAAVALTALIITELACGLVALTWDTPTPR